MKQSSEVRLPLSVEENFALIQKSNLLGISKRKLAKSLMRECMIRKGMIEPNESDKARGLIQ